MNYQVGTVLPYWVKTYILRRKGLPEPKLYRFDEYSDRQDGALKDNYEQKGGV